ncbi:MAG TPA: Lpg1974 family pore-forming outer membrane protein [Chlamydiales bacterium]|nr:Lpg1974 family pore-forming outer membrane protein [Chlamydiales bacterium]
MKKLTSLLMLALTASAFAIPKGPCDQKHDVCCEDANDVYAFSYTQDIGLSCPRDYYIHGDFLFMQSHEDGLEFAISNDSTSTPATLPLENGQIRGFTTGSHTKDWDMGFRFGIGAFLSTDGWDLHGMWTHLHGNVDKTVGTTGNTVLSPLWFPPAVTQTCQQASARWKLDLNSLDLMLGKPYHVSRYFVANPYFGARYSFIDQDYKARYGGDFGKATMTGKNNFWGFGLRPGFEGKFLVNSHITIFGNIAASILWSKFDVDQQTENVPTDPSTGNYVFHNEFYTTATNLESALGIAWGTLFSEARYHIDVRLAYEFQKWFEQNRFRRFFDNGNSIVSNKELSKSDLNFEGLSLRLQFDF